MKVKIQKQNLHSRGFSILEILVACSIILTSVFSIMSLSQKSVQYSRLALDQERASFLLEEGAEAIKSIRDNGWTNISTKISGVPYFLVLNNGVNYDWVLSLSNDYPTGSFIRTITFGDVYRDNTTQDIVTETDNSSLPVITAMEYYLYNNPPRISVYWNTNVPSDSQVVYGTTSCPTLPCNYTNSTNIDATQTQSHIMILNGLAPSTTYYFRVKSRDASGNLVTSYELWTTTGAPPDNIPPSIYMTSPSAGGISDVVTVSANASDNIGVDHVDFYLDNSFIGARGFPGPYAINWNSASATNGYHSLMGIAYDAAGNSAASNPVGVTVSNSVQVPPDVSPPIVSINSPVAKSLLSGVVTLYATATDDVGVSYVDFYYDDIFIDRDTTASVDKGSSYAITWDMEKSKVPKGSYKLTARAYDAARNMGVSDNVPITVVEGGTSNNDSGGTQQSGTPIYDYFQYVLQNVIDVGARLDSKVNDIFHQILNEGFNLDDNAQQHLQYIIDYGVYLNETAINTLNTVINYGTPLDPNIRTSLQNMLDNGVTLDSYTQQILLEVIDGGKLTDADRLASLQNLLYVGAQLDPTLKKIIESIISISDNTPVSKATEPNIFEKIYSYVIDSFRNISVYAAETSYLDTGTRKVTITVSWSDAGMTQNKAISFYISNIAKP